MESHDQPSAIKYSFGKKERLKSKKSIKELFSKGSSFFLYTFKVLYLPASNDSETNQALIAVSTRSFKKAVHRNKTKRRIREAYRLNKHSLASDPPLHIGLVYVGKEILPYQVIESKLKLILLRLNEVRFKKE